MRTEPFLCPRKIFVQNVAFSIFFIKDMVRYHKNVQVFFIVLFKIFKPLFSQFLYSSFLARKMQKFNTSEKNYRFHKNALVHRKFDRYLFCLFSKVLQKYLLLFHVTCIFRQKNAKMQFLEKGSGCYKNASAS